MLNSTAIGKLHDIITGFVEIIATYRLLIPEIRLFPLGLGLIFYNLKPTPVSCQQHSAPG